MSDATLTFEAAFDRLQETIGRLEQGGLSLDAAIAAFEDGMALANRCAEILDAAELRVTKVLESGPSDADELAF
ncbi:MAG: exodeoxyribonuclease VII small subunit [Chloroflexi bacterium]|nr:exodeoxyribonuclease VII small subunit [Chloroflexota bacterium]